MSDFEQIHSLLAAYCHVTDRGTAEDIATFFWDDARLVFNDEFNGRAEIEASYEDWIKNMRDPVENLRHLIYSPYVEMRAMPLERFATSMLTVLLKKRHTNFSKRRVPRPPPETRWRLEARRTKNYRLLDEVN